MPITHPTRLLFLLAPVVLAACGGGGGAPTPPAAEAPLVAVAQPGELLAVAKQRLAAQASQGPVDHLALGAPALGVASDASGPSTVLRSATVVQEAGVDEADLIKSTPTHVYTLDDSQAHPTTGVRALRLRSHALQPGGGTTPVATLALADAAGASAAVHGLLLAPGVQRAAALAEWVSYTAPVNPCAGLADCWLALPALVHTSTEVRVQVASTPADGSLALQHTLAITGRLVGSRLVDNQLVLVTTHAPTVAGVAPAERVAAIERLTNADLLPKLRLDGQPGQPLLNDTDCYVQTAGADPSPGLQLTTITVLDLASPTLARRSRCFVGHVEAMYLSPRHLYLATTRSETVNEGGALRYTGTLLTDIHKFTLAGLDWRGTGQVNGHLGWDEARKPYRLSEHGEHLRVLSFTGDTGWATLEDATRRAASPATLTVLREAGDGRRLAVVATLPNSRRTEALGRPGEQVHGVRFVGERGYVVTFRRTDPLYVLDLADPADPRVAGALEVPGFAEHLFALDNGLLFGAGFDADANGLLGGLRWTLFDVANPAQPRQLHSEVTGGRFSTSTLNFTPHGLALRTDGAQVRLAVPVMLAAGDTQYTAGVQRLLVDTQARTLAAKPLLPVDAMLTQGLWGQRLVHSGEQLLHLVGGELLQHGW